MESYFVFVYGTLRRGFANHYLLKESGFLGMGRTREQYALYAGAFPYAVRDEKVCPIAGELYEVSAETLDTLDDLEEHPNWYRREEITVVLEDGNEYKAWMYFYPERTGRILKSGDYSKECTLS